MKTLCSKCIFADNFDASEPCAMNIIERIRGKYSIETDGDGFNIINDYRCLYGFDLVTYDKNKEQIGGLDKLTAEIYRRCEVPYYMVLFATEASLDHLLINIKNLSIKPKYLSIILFSNNNTSLIIGKLKAELTDFCEWKLHNFLDEEPKEKALNIVFDTNKNKNNSEYAWIIDSEMVQDLDKQIADINEIMTITKPKAHMLCRTKNFLLDGLFISFDNLRSLCRENERLISEGIKSNSSEILISNYC
jgi:hypothetical protein